jgi:hypothetical protein
MRKKKTITIEAEGRDKGKEFVLEELCSYDAEQWVWRLLPVLARAGFEVNDSVLKGGFGAIMAVGAQALFAMPYEFVKSMMDAMLPCIKYRHYDTKGHAQDLQEIKTNANCQIEEISTWFHLRKEVLELHTGPLKAAGSSKGSEASPPHRAA